MNKEDFDLEVERLEKSKRPCTGCDQLFLPEDLTDLCTNTADHEEIEVQLCSSCLVRLQTPPQSSCFVCIVAVCDDKDSITIDDGEQINIKTKICCNCLDTVLERNGYEVCEECEKHSKGLSYIVTHHATREDPEEGISICESCADKRSNRYDD